MIRYIVFQLICLFLPMISSAQGEIRLGLPLGHSNIVRFAAYSPDDKMVITTSDDKTAKIWDVATGKLLMNLVGHLGKVSFAVFSPDGQTIATVSEDGTVKLWGIYIGEQLFSLAVSGEVPKFASFSPDGNTLVTFSMASGAQLWDVHTGKLLHTLPALFDYDKSSYLNTNSFPDMAFPVFSPDGKSLVTADQYGKVSVWEVKNGKLRYSMDEHVSYLYTVLYSPDGSKILTADAWGTKLWEARNGKVLFSFKGESARFSPDGNRVLTAFFPNEFSEEPCRVYDIKKGKLLFGIQGESVSYSPDGKFIMTDSMEMVSKIWNADSGKLWLRLKGNHVMITQDNTTALTGDFEQFLQWDLTNGNLLDSVDGWNTTLAISNKGETFVTSADGNEISILDAKSGRLLHQLRGHSVGITSSVFMPDNQTLLIASSDDKVRVWDESKVKVSYPIILSRDDSMNVVYSNVSAKGISKAIWMNDGTLHTENTETGDTIGFYQRTYRPDRRVISPDGKKEIQFEQQGDVLLVDRESGAYQRIAEDALFLAAEFSPDSKSFVSCAGLNEDFKVSFWDVSSGKITHSLDMKAEKETMVSAATFSPDGSILATSSLDGISALWDVATGKKISSLQSETDIKTCWWGFGESTRPAFSPDGKTLVTASLGVSSVWEVETGKLRDSLNGHSDWVSSVNYSPDGKYIVTSSLDSKTIVWDAVSGEMLYTLILIDDKDFLVYDKYFRYDGSANSRKLLYMICGAEIIALDQVKDQLWVPGLVDRIMRGEKINALQLSDLDLCNFIPLVSLVEVPRGDSATYKFSIEARQGGLSEAVVSVNGIEWKRIAADQLTVNDSMYEVMVTADELKDYMNAFQKNTLSVQAFSLKDHIGSRVAVADMLGMMRSRDINPPIVLDEHGNPIQEVGLSPKPVKPPVLYAVVVGVSDYKGDSIDLVYPASDAQNFSRTLEMSANKFLGIDGQPGAFVYTLFTDDEDSTSYGFPDKISIRKVFEEIGTKAEPQDILLIFFAGHGITKANDKSFSFITANASQNNYTDSGSGITTKELFEWIQPRNIKAQKRVLIFDACYSGQAITDMVSIGEQDQQFAAARGLDDLEFVKALDKLKEQSGLSILSASTSDQLAWERFTFGGGILTYSLLKSVKSNPNILDDGMLNLGRWFDAAKSTVEEVSSKYKIKQSPQVISTNNFNIGIVDDTVRSSIVLPREKPMIGSSNFQDEEQMDDVLGLNILLEEEFSNISTRSIDSPITYFKDGTDAWKMSGRYTVTGKSVEIKVALKQPDGVRLPIKSFSGKTDDLKGLVKMLIDWALGKLTSS